MVVLDKPRFFATAFSEVGSTDPLLSPSSATVGAGSAKKNGSEKMVPGHCAKWSLSENTDRGKMMNVESSEIQTSKH